MSSKNNNKFKTNTVVKEYFVISENKISSRCILCGKSYKHYGNTTNLTRHLNTKHATQINNIRPSQKKLQVSENDVDSRIEEETTDDINPVLSPHSHGCASAQSTSKLYNKEVPIDEAFRKISSFAGNASRFSPDEVQIKKCEPDGGSSASGITDALLYMIAKDYQPFSIVEDIGFRKLMHVVAPLYKIPSRKTLSYRIEDKYRIISMKVKASLVEVNNVVLTTDIWTDCLNTKSYLGLTIHYIENMNMRSIDLGIEGLEKNHDASYLVDRISEICDKWEITQEKVVAVVTDNGANIVKAVRNKFGYKKHMPCFAHTINLVVQDSIRSVVAFQEVVKKVKTIVTHFKHSVNAMDELRKVQVQDSQTEGTVLKLKQECETRWNSVLYMLQRFSALAEYVSVVLFKKSIPEMLISSELETIEDAIIILSPLEEVTAEMSAENYVTASKIIPIVNCLIKTLEKFTAKTKISQQLQKVILDNLIKRFHSDDSNIEKNLLLAISTLLDPRFKKVHFRRPLAVANAIAEINKQILEIKNDTNKSPTVQKVGKKQCHKNDLWNIHEELVASNCSTERDMPGGISVELRQFLDTPLIKISENPLKYWDGIKTVYPHCYQMAVKYLTLVASSVPAERLFSKAGNVLTEKRNRLQGSRVSKLLFLHSVGEDYWK